MKAIPFTHNDSLSMAYPLYPGACNPDHSPKERDPIRRPLWCESVSSDVFYDTITTSRNGEGQAKDEREDVQEGKKAGNPNAKKARIPPGLLRYDRLMQVCLGPAHGMHTVMTPDLMTLGYSSEEADTFYLFGPQRGSPIRGMALSGLIPLAVS